MKIEIERVYHEGGTLNVEVSHEYGEQTLGLHENADRIDPKTGEPRWKIETRRLLEKQYGEKLEDGRASAQQEEEVQDEDIGKEMDLKDLPKK